jgi:hypothetical protein
MTDWLKIERILDDRSVAHGCAFCGSKIAAGDVMAWSLAIRRPEKSTSVVWVHRDCLLDRMTSRVRQAIEHPPTVPPPA